jgi:hypothetical protein
MQYAANLFDGWDIYAYAKGLLIATGTAITRHVSADIPSHQAAHLRIGEQPPQ